MALDKNYSTINKQKKIFDVVEANFDTPRTIVKIASTEYTAGITAGDVIRYDTYNQIYEKSIANIYSENAEVFGIVENIDSDLNLNVVTNGSINLPANHLINTSGSNLGGNDIYFLSGTSAGYLQNSGPTFTGYIVKPIYQVAPHGEYTGLVRNYIGFKYGQETIQYNDLRLLSFSQGMEYSIEYSESTRFLHVFSISHTANTFTKVPRYILYFPPQVPYQNTIDFDIKISTNGRDFLVFSKTQNKIYHLYVNDTGNFELKATISFELPGPSADKLWACDDELTCFTISSRGLEAEDNPNLYRLHCHSISSKIKYYKRTMNSSNKYRWRCVNENHAAGVVTPVMPNLASANALPITSGIFRTYDIQCTGKNFALSTISLSQDQIDYQVKINGSKLQKYSNVDLGVTKENLVSHYITSIDGDSIESGDELYVRNIFFGDISVLNQNSDANAIKYFSIGKIKNYRILAKNSGYYWDDPSHRDSGGYQVNQGSTLTAFSTSISVNLENKITRAYPTANKIYYALLFSNNYFVVEKRPFFSEDGLQAFQYYDYSVILGRFSPNSSDYGTLVENTNSSINAFNLFATDDHYFICTPSQVIINNTHTINISNFHNAKFYNSEFGIFFTVDTQIYKFTAPNQLTLQNY